MRPYWSKAPVRAPSSDLDGSYQIEVPSTESILVFSYTGFATQEITVGTQSVIDIMMSPDYAQLEEIVVTGYGVQKKANLSGAVDNVTTEQLASRPVANLAQGLQGISPNLNIDFNSGRTRSRSQAEHPGLYFSQWWRSASAH